MTDFKAIKIPVDSTKPIEEVHITEASQIAPAINANIFEVVYTNREDVELLADEEGLLVPNPERNIRAELLYASIQGKKSRAGLCLCGDMLLTGGVDEAVSYTHLTLPTKRIV